MPEFLQLGKMDSENELKKNEYFYHTIGYDITPQSQEGCERNQAALNKYLRTSISDTTLFEFYCYTRLGLPEELLYKI